MLCKYLLLVLLIFGYSEYNIQINNDIIIFTLINYKKSITKHKTKQYAIFNIDSYHRIEPFGYPNIPIIRKAFIGSNKFKILESKGYLIKTEKIFPIIKSQSRCDYQNKYNISFDNIYKKNSFIPNMPISIQYYNNGQSNIKILEIQPLQYNPYNDTIYVNTFIKIKIYPTKEKLRVTYTENKLYNKILLNYKYIEKNIIPERVLIVAHDRYYTIGTRFAKHRNITNDVIYKKISEIGNNIKLKEYIKKLYQETDSLKYVILIGNYGDIKPLESNRYFGNSDSLYGQINDGIINIYVSRIFGHTIEDVENQINKIIKFTIPRNKVGFLGIASDENVPSIPTDCEFIERLHSTINNMSNIKFDYNKICDPNASKEQVKRVINNKEISFVNYIGHGNGTNWITSKFGVNDTNLLTKNNFIVVDVACLNGNPYYKPFLAESLLNKKYGAVAMYSSIPLADWIPPVYMQFHAYHTLLSMTEPITLGMMIYSGTMMSCIQYPSQCGKMMDGYILYGDSSMPVIIPK